MMSSSENIGMPQSKRVGWNGDFRRNDENTTDANGSRAQQPYRIVIAGDGRRHRQRRRAEYTRHGVLRHCIRQKGRKSVAARLDVERSQLQKNVKRVGRWTSDIDAI